MLFDFLTPDVMIFATSFLFVFAIVFALLVYVKIFKESRPAMAIIAAVIAFSAAVYEGSAIIIQQIMPYASIVLVVLFFIVFVKKIFERDETKGGKRDLMPTVIVLAIALILLAVFWPQIANMAGLGGLESDNVLWGIGILVVVLIFWSVYKMSSGESGGSGGSGGGGGGGRPP